MKAAVTEQIPLRETSTLELLINRSDCPDDAKIDKVIDEIVKKYDLKNTKFTTKICGAKGMRRTKLIVKAVATPGGEPIVAALEMFSWMLGNIEIYKRVVEYSCV